MAQQVTNIGEHPSPEQQAQQNLPPPEVAVLRPRPKRNDLAFYAVGLAAIAAICYCFRPRTATETIWRVDERRFASERWKRNRTDRRRAILTCSTVLPNKLCHSDRGRVCSRTILRRRNLFPKGESRKSGLQFAGFGEFQIVLRQSFGEQVLDVGFFAISRHGQFTYQ